MGFKSVNGGPVAPRVYEYLQHHPGQTVTPGEIAKALGLPLASSVSTALGNMVAGRYGALLPDGGRVTNPYPNVERIKTGVYRYVGEPAPEPEPDDEAGCVPAPGWLLVRVLAETPKGQLVQDDDTKVVYYLVEA
jgi:hypothetical protein